MAETGPGASGGGAAGTSEEFSHDAMAFEALERDFQEVLFVKPAVVRVLRVGLLRRFRGVLQVLQSVMSDKSLDKFRQEYEKLHTALKKVGIAANRPRNVAIPLFVWSDGGAVQRSQAYDNEKRLVKKVRELNNEIVTNGEGVLGCLCALSGERWFGANLAQPPRWQPR
jgi:hypothetical protein